MITPSFTTRGDGVTYHFGFFNNKRNRKAVTILPFPVLVGLLACFLTTFLTLTLNAYLAVFGVNEVGEAITMADGAYDEGGLAALETLAQDRLDVDLVVVERAP